MRFSSFIAITAAGLAIAAPITPVSPSNVEKQLTVEPVELYKRQLPTVPDTSAVSGLTKGLPVPVGKRQLGGLGSLVPGSDDASAEDDEAVVPKAPKEPKLPSSVSDDDEDKDDTEATDDDTDAADSATSKIPIGGLPVGKRGLPLVGDLPLPVKRGLPLVGDLPLPVKRGLPLVGDLPLPVKRGLPAVGDLTKGLPVGKRQLGNLGSLLGMDKADPAPAANSTTAAAEETPSPTPTPTPSPEATPAPAPAGGLGGILKSRQLSGLLGGDKKDAAAADADDADTTVKSNSQTNAADDGTNTPETKFSSDEPADETEDEETEEATPTEDEAETEATPAAEETVPAVAAPTTPAAPAGGLGGLGGVLGM